MCAGTAGRRGRRVLVLEKNSRAGEKSLISGGGRCNFTKLYIEPGCFISANPHFCKSALKRYIQQGLYFIGEVVDVTGHPGGFNFQWAWSSGVAAGQNA